MATEDYLKKPLSFRIRKVLRYVEHYGIRRTLIKVRGQYHMKSEDGFSGKKWNNPSGRQTGNASCRAGLLGCGSFAFSTIAFYLARSRSSVLRAAMDHNSCRAKSLVVRYGGAYATVDASDIFSDPQINLVFIASNHASHASYAVEALDSRKHVHIEKPHVVSEQQLVELLLAMDRNPEQMVFLGFNRPRSKLYQRLKAELNKEAGPMMINWFIAGHALQEDHWYFAEQEGGRILGNLCHWSDLTLDMVGRELAFPATIVPTSSPGAKSDFVTAIQFADGSLASLTFSAKGHTFDGVSEVLNLHKGNLLAELRDFKSLSLVRGAKRIKKVLLTRDHGHEANVTNSVEACQNGDTSRAVSRAYIDATAKLFLGIRKAHSEQRTVIVS